MSLLVCIISGGCQPFDGPTSIITIPNPPRVTFTQNVSDSTGRRIVITCKASSVDPATERLVDMSIQRVLHANPDADPVSIAEASQFHHQGNAVLQTQAPQKSNVTGSLFDSVITLILYRATCGDSGKYICTATSEDSIKSKKYASDINILIQVNPGPITKKLLNTSGTGCKVGQTLTMTCGQFVGAEDNSSQHNWVWEFKDKNDTDWQSYAVIGNPTADITESQPPSTHPTCYKHHSSSLSRRVTPEDSERQYRCYVNGKVTGQGVDKAKIHSVQVSGNTGKATDSQVSATNWLAVGLGVAGAVACLGVGLGVALHSKRKESGQQSMTPASSSAPPPPPPAGGNMKTAMNTGDTAHVGQSGQDPNDDIYDDASEATSDAT
ncbi:hypothetical protein V1264_017863 [Littorina saxatilis]|uniref:Ig-like domain-containing protein n=1 Tax=Littorina saxatilis TaxID=31220 RepID=A0AAN9BJI1_9CAEN